MLWEVVETCNFCGGSAAEPYFTSDVPPWYQKKPMELVKCSGCGLVRANPRPQVEGLYKNYMAAADNVREIVQRKLERPNVRVHHRKAIVEAMSYAKREVKALYDMGCGAGTVMMEAADMGLAVEGNDINKAAVEMLNERGLKAHFGFTKDIRPERSFDVVMNLDYLEHSFEPFDDLKTSWKLLNPGGVLYLKTLYLGCPDHVREAEHWKLFGNGHFHYFFPETLREMVKGAGFEIAAEKMGALVTVVGLKPEAAA